MRSSLADYQLLGPFGPNDDGTWLARPPARLGMNDSTVVVTEIAYPASTDWGDVIERLSDLAAVAHEHLPRLIEAGRSGDDHDPVAWVTRDHAEGRPLSTADPKPDQSLRAVAGAARAAHALHEAGWAHGNIRPGAVLVTADTVMLEPPVRTVAGCAVLAGPPRTPTEFDPVDASALWGEGPSRAGDIWSLGATAHALVTGRLVHPALAGDPIVTAAQRILLEAPQLAGLDAGLEELLRSCLSPDPDERPQTAAELAEQLELLADRP